MKTKDLIEALQEADPTGEVECCVDNVDIHFVGREPAFYDGKLQLLIRDESNPYYNIIGAKYVSKGDKVVIHPLTFEDAISNDPALPIDYSEVTNGAAELRDRDDKWRNDVRDIEQGIERDHFVKFAPKFVDKSITDLAGLAESATQFFNSRLSSQDPFPPFSNEKKFSEKHNYWYVPSWNDRREAQWLKEISLTRRETPTGVQWIFERIRNESHVSQ